MARTGQIQGRNITVQVFQAGKVIAGITAKSLKHGSKNDVRERDLLGESRTQTQLLIHGYKGSIEFDVDSKRHAEISRYLNDSDKAGTANYEFAIQIRERYKDGSSHKYRYTKVTLVPPDMDVTGRKEDVKGTMEWHAEDRVDL